MTSKSEKLEEKSVTKEETNPSEKCLTAPRVSVLKEENIGKEKSVQISTLERDSKSQKKQTTYYLFNRIEEGESSNYGRFLLEPAFPERNDPELRYYELESEWESDPWRNVKLSLDECHPIYLSVEPSEFVINPEKGTKFTIKSLSTRPQDVIVTCNSYIFQIKNPRGFHKMKSQIFRRMKHNEKMEFEIGMRDPKIESVPFPENLRDIPQPTFAIGYLSIHHYRANNKRNDSDEDWGIYRKNQIVLPGVYKEDSYGHWMDVLKLEHKTEEITALKAKYAEEYFKHRESVTEQYLGKMPGLQEYMTTKDPEEKEIPKKLSEPEPEKKKKKKKKCVVM